MNRTWTDEQEQYLVAHYATTSNAELAAALGKKNADRVMAKASLLGLKKSRQFLKESCQQRENSGKFKKGMTLHNNFLTACCTQGFDTPNKSKTR